jgi:hypothetical protein
VRQNSLLSRDRAGESRNTPGRRRAGEVDVLLDRERNAVHRPERLTRGNLAVRFSRIASRLFSECLHNGVETRIDSLDAAKMRFDDLSAGKVFPRNFPCQLAGGQGPKFGHAFLPFLPDSQRARPAIP